jgi:hypothetical protein
METLELLYYWLCGCSDLVMFLCASLVVFFLLLFTSDLWKQLQLELEQFISFAEGDELYMLS